MPLLRRPNLPGVSFHLTARLQNRVHLLTPELRTAVVRLLAVRLRVSDARLLAYVVMSNHLHLVVRQGEQPLSALMQPFLRSTAALLQGRCGLEGHVFERRYADRVIRNADHMRAAIGYVHANPVRAGMVSEPADYVWSSHRLYVRCGRVRGMRVPVDWREGLRESGFGNAAAEAAQRYSAYLGELMADVRSLSKPEKAASRIDPGNQACAAASRQEDRAARLTSLVEQTVADEALREQLRSRWGSRERLRFRHAFVLEAARHGFSGVEIAQFLQISPASVSRILRARL
jgi:putative transposase